MDERTMQLKQLKKAYKKERRRAGLLWRIPGHLFMALAAILAVITVYVCCHEAAWVQWFEMHCWLPVKSALALPLPYEKIWLLALDHGVIAVAAAAVLGLILLGLGGACKRRTKTSDAYRNYRTMKLTLETEKEENR